MKKRTKIIIILVVVVILLLLIPKIDTLNDGGTKIYKSLVYEVTKVNKINSDSKDGYERGTIIKIFNKEIFNDVSFEVREMTEEELIKLHTYVSEKLVDEYSNDNFVDSYINLIDMKIHIILKDTSEDKIEWIKKNVIDSVFVVCDKESVEK